MGDRADVIEADEMAVANYVHVGYGDQFTAVGRPADQLGCVGKLVHGPDGRCPPPLRERLSRRFVIAANASCALSVGFEGPTSLRMAFSLTPSRRAIARLLIPWLFSVQITVMP